MGESFIKRRREELGYSQSQFSEMSGVNFRTLQDYEQGRKPVSSVKSEVLYRISANLGCSMEELLLETECGASGMSGRVLRYMELLNQSLDARHDRQIHTPFDDVFRTLSVDCSELLIPVINLIFNENYELSALVEQRQNEHFSHGDDGKTGKRISDANFIILEKDGVRRHYQVECQSRIDHTILIRLFEYASATAMEDGKLIGSTLHISYPKSALVYLRHTKNTPERMEVELDTPGGLVSWEIPVMKAQTYTIDDIFEKRLYMLIPFYLLTYEARLAAIEQDEDALSELKNTYADLFSRMEEAIRRGELDTYQWITIRNMSKRVCDHLTGKYHRINTEVKSVMGGQVLDHEAKQILRRGISQGITQGISQGITQGISQGISQGIKQGSTQSRATDIRNLMDSLSLTAEQAMEALKVPVGERDMYREIL